MDEEEDFYDEMPRELGDFEHWHDNQDEYY